MSFAPYQPPPDLPPQDDLPGGKGKNKPKRPWFNRDASSFFATSAGAGGTNYQSGGSTNSQSYSSVQPSGPIASSSSAHYSGGNGQAPNYSVAEEGGTANSWETRFGWRVDFEAGATYLLGPLTAVLLLILETTNDFVRFHAYQSALLTTPLLLLHFFLKLIFPYWLQSVISFGSFGLVVFMAYRAFVDANRGLERFYLPVLGELAERWVGDE
ncbi:hypothetical protein [Phaffia rhodozyma]|uniref:Uncharacterized protein n=1 Tax=Phaffia rhodozyma TaxID=264483 RepID=A0A0F7SGP8_PHARH|nr:hypothetical protein [Phaffia rhodozyma]